MGPRSGAVHVPPSCCAAPGFVRPVSPAPAGCPAARGRGGAAGDVVGHLHATSEAAELPPCDFGIVATKAMHTEPAIRATARVFADGCVCSVQNGLGNEETLAEHVARVIRGTTFPAGRVVEPGHVQWDVKGDTTIGPFEPSPAPTADVAQLADACTRGGMPTQAVADARGP